LQVFLMVDKCLQSAFFRSVSHDELAVSLRSVRGDANAPADCAHDWRSARRRPARVGR
jgi:hypothetical protein